MPFAVTRQDVRRMLEPLTTLVPALGVGAVFCIALSVVFGHEPLDLVVAVGEGAWGSASGAVATLTKLTPLLLTGLAVAMAFHAGLLNIGCEGQLTLGALAAATLAVSTPAASLPAVVLIPITALTGAAVGALWAYPAAWLRQRKGVHEVITTLLLNYVAIYLADYLARGPLGDGSAMARTPPIPAGAEWPAVLHSGTLVLTAAPLFAFLLALAAQVWLSRTVWGYEVSATGSNPLGARVSGVPVGRWQRRMFISSGALAGLAGALEIAAIHHRFYAAFSPGYGFDGITVAFLVGSSPGWLWLSALLLASLRSADKWLQLALGISPNAILLVEAVLLLAVACRAGWLHLIRRLQPGGGT